MSPYFDRTYFDGTYFDVDAAAVSSGKAARGGPRRLPDLVPPELLLAEDEDFLSWIT